MEQYSDNFNKFLTETIYGDEFDAQDLKNTRVKYKAVFQGKRCLSIGKQTNSNAFCDGYLHLYERVNILEERAYKYKKALKIDKDYEYVCKKLNEKEQEFKGLENTIKKEYILKLQQEIENTEPYKKLLYNFTILKSNLDNQETLHHQIEQLKKELAEERQERAELELPYKENYKKALEKEKKKLQNEYEKKIKDYVKTDEKLEVSEYKKQIKNLENELKIQIQNNNKNNDEKYNDLFKKYEKLKKININLMNDL